MDITVTVGQWQSFLQKEVGLWDSCYSRLTARGLIYSLITFPLYFLSVIVSGQHGEPGRGSHSVGPAVKSRQNKEMGQGSRCGGQSVGITNMMGQGSRCGGQSVWDHQHDETGKSLWWSVSWDHQHDEIGKSLWWSVSLGSPT